MSGLGGLAMAQAKGGLPATIVAGSAPGESGVAVFRLQAQHGLSFSAVPENHLIWFPVSSTVGFECRMAGEVISHVPPVGTLAITPASIDCSGEAMGDTDLILVAIDPGHLALLASEEAAPGAQLGGRLSGYDQELFNFARTLALESERGYANGALFWNDVASRFIGGLLARHRTEPNGVIRGTLREDVFRRIRDYVMAHLEERIEVATLAAMAGWSPFHFTRVFTKTVGVTPHRYIVHLRLQRAVELIRDGRHELTEIALCTGFADQSHLTRWIRRVHGAPPTQLVG